MVQTVLSTELGAVEMVSTNSTYNGQGQKHQGGATSLRQEMHLAPRPTQWFPMLRLSPMKLCHLTFGPIKHRGQLIKGRKLVQLN